MPWDLSATIRKMQAITEHPVDPRVAQRVMLFADGDGDVLRAASVALLRGLAGHPENAPDLVPGAAGAACGVDGGAQQHVRLGLSVACHGHEVEVRLRVGVETLGQPRDGCVEGGGEVVAEGARSVGVGHVSTVR